jgi:hypothetical protein
MSLISKNRQKIRQGKNLRIQKEVGYKRQLLNNLFNPANLTIIKHYFDPMRMYWCSCEYFLNFSSGKPACPLTDNPGLILSLRVPSINESWLVSFMGPDFVHEIRLQ